MMTVELKNIHRGMMAVADNDVVFGVGAEETTGDGRVSSSDDGGVSTCDGRRVSVCRSSTSLREISSGCSVVFSSCSIARMMGCSWCNLSEGGGASKKDTHNEKRADRWWESVGNERRIRYVER